MKISQPTFAYILPILAILISITSLLFVLANKNVVADDINFNNIHEKMTGVESEGMPKSLNTIPTMPGQEAFGTIQEIMTILESNPMTDWAKVDIDTLREHLIDMNELTMYSNVERQDIPGGLKMVVTGNKRTVEALQRMVPTHNQMTLKFIDEWKTDVEIIDRGVVLTVTSIDASEVDKIRGLGFIGIMAEGSQHPLHHLMMAKGEMHNE